VSMPREQIQQLLQTMQEQYVRQTYICSQICLTLETVCRQVFSWPGPPSPQITNAFSAQARKVALSPPSSASKYAKPNTRFGQGPHPPPPHPHPNMPPSLHCPDSCSQIKGAMNAYRWCSNPPMKFLGLDTQIYPTTRRTPPIDHNP
jgi:hypothetical protein